MGADSAPGTGLALVEGSPRAELRGQTNEIEREQNKIELGVHDDPHP